jgi:hypothetical protein
MDQTGQFIKDYKWPLGGAALYALTQEKPKGVEPENPTPPGKIRPFVYDPKTQGLTQLRPYNAPGYADGGGIEEDPNAQMIPSYDPVVRMASGGLGSLGGYSDGGRMLKGPGDGMSDNIPAVIGGKQPARLADGEFVVPADVVSHLGNGSTDAGAKQLYKMMDRIRQQRTGKKRQAPEVNPHKAMPA